MIRLDGGSTRGLCTRTTETVHIIRGVADKACNRKKWSSFAFQEVRTVYSISAQVIRFSLEHSVNPSRCLTCENRMRSKRALCAGVFRRA